MVVVAVIERNAVLLKVCVSHSMMVVSVDDAAFVVVDVVFDDVVEVEVDTLLDNMLLDPREALLVAVVVVVVVFPFGGGLTFRPVTVVVFAVVVD